MGIVPVAVCPMSNTAPHKKIKKKAPSSSLYLNYVVLGTIFSRKNPNTTEGLEIQRHHPLCEQNVCHGNSPPGTPVFSSFHAPVA